MDRPEPGDQRPQQGLGRELRSSLLLLCALLGPILGLVVIVHEHDRRVTAHQVCVHLGSTDRPAQHC